MKKKRRAAPWWRKLMRVLLWLFFLQLGYIIILKWVYPPITITQFVSWVRGEGLKRDYVDGDKISYQARLAVIASEDQLFPDHAGFDWKSIKKAIAYNKRKPGRIRGGSTISQQTAKNVFLWQGRSRIRKGMEAYFTKMIEWIWGKERILEVYLNVIEMGKGVYGVQAASKHYFKKDASKLSRANASQIAACLPNPKRLRVHPPTKFVKSRSVFIQQQMRILEKDPDVREVIW